jgi:acyl dehydratase
VSEKIGSSNVLDISAEEAMQIVRTGQDSTFYRPIKSGEKLYTSGQVTQIKQTSAGALIVQKIETVVEDTREPVVTSWVSWIMRGAQIEGQDRETERPVALDIEPPPLNELIATEIFIPRKTPHVFAECSGIWNPINTQRKAALAAGLPDVILHGMATWSIAGREVLKTQGQNNPSRMKRFTADFRAMIVPGGTIRLLQGRCVTNPEAVYYCVENQRGETAVSGFVFLETI